MVYEGTLWIVDDERNLTPHHFEFLAGVANLAVFGELRVDPEVTPQALSARLAKVHNLGAIWCTSDQMKVIRALLGLQDGELLDTMLNGEAQGQESPQAGPTVDRTYTEMIGNSAYLVL